MTARLLIEGRLCGSSLPWGAGDGDWRNDGLLCGGKWFAQIGAYFVSLETFDDRDFRVTVRRSSLTAVRTKSVRAIVGGQRLSDLGNVVFQSVPADREEIAAQMFNCVVVGFRLGGTK